MRSISATLPIVLVGALLGLVACKKDPYPACRKDKHCQAGERCVDNLCHQCETDEECKGKGPQGADLVCVEFRCEMLADGAPCESVIDCEPGQICLDGTCQFCTDDSQCESGVCNKDSGRCKPLPCQTDDDCPVDEVCDGGECVYKPLDSENAEAVCGLRAVYFAFDSDKLTPDNQELLKGAANCFIDLLKQGGELVLEAHADNVGGEEYNILLTDRRGTSVQSFLVNMGVPKDQLRVVGKGALEAQGTDEAGRAKDRRVQFIHSGPTQSPAPEPPSE